MMVDGLLNGFPEIGIPPNGMVYIRENPIKMDDKNRGTPILGNHHIF